MLIKESQFVNSKEESILDKLNEAVYLTQEEASIHPVEISVFEMSRLGEGSAVVGYNEVERLAESKNVSFAESLAAIAEANEVDLSKLTIAVDEADLIEDASIVKEMSSYVVVPVSENDIIYQACSEAVDEFVENDDSSLLEALVNEGIGDLVKKIREKKEQAKQAGVPTPAPKLLPSSTPVKPVTEGKAGDIGKKMVGLGLLGVGAGAAGTGYTLHKIKGDMEAGKGFGQSVADHSGAGVASAAAGSLGATSIKIGGTLYIGDKIYQHFKNKPKNVIAKAIASLRRKYASIMDKAQSASNKTLAGKLKNAGGKILEIIDRLMEKLQQGANKLG